MRANVRPWHRHSNPDENRPSMRCRSSWQPTAPHPAGKRQQGKTEDFGCHNGCSVPPAWHLRSIAWHRVPVRPTSGPWPRRYDHRGRWPEADAWRCPTAWPGYSCGADGRSGYRLPGLAEWTAAGWPPPSQSPAQCCFQGCLSARAGRR
ncbi:hypothetical protein D3C81_604960 [compost metagenome]